MPGRLNTKRLLVLAELAFDRLLSYSNNLGSLWIVVVMLFIMSDVIGRAAFNHSIMGVAELVATSIVGMLFLQVAYVLRRGRHIRATLLVSSLPPMGGITIDIIAYCIGLTFCILLTLSAWPIAWQMTLIGEYRGPDSFPVYTYHVRWIIVAAGILMSIQLLLNLFRSFKTVLSLRKGYG